MPLESREGERSKDNSWAGISVRVTKGPVRQKTSLKAMWDCVSRKQQVWRLHNSLYMRWILTIEVNKRVLVFSTEEEDK